MFTQFNTKLFTLFATLFACSCVFAQAPYTSSYWQGSIAIIGYNTHGGINGNGNEEIAILVLKPIDKGTKIYITNKEPGKNFIPGSSSLPMSSGTKGTAQIELLQSVVPGTILFIKGINPSGTAHVNSGIISVDGKFQLGNGEAWLFYVSEESYTNGSVHKPSMFCSAFLWGDDWEYGNGSNKYFVVDFAGNTGVTGLVDGVNAMKNDVTNNAWKCGQCALSSFNLTLALTNINGAGLYNGSNPAINLNNSANSGTGGTWTYTKPNNGSTWANTACDFNGLVVPITYTTVKYDGNNWLDINGNQQPEPTNKFSDEIIIDKPGGVVKGSEIYDSGTGSGSRVIRAGKLTVKAGTTLEIEPGDTIQISEEIDVEATAELIFRAAVDNNRNVIYPEYYNSLASLTPGTEITVEQYIIEPYWHHLSSPVSATLQDIVFDNSISLPGFTSATESFELRNTDVNVQNIYYWEHDYNKFGWERELDFNSDFSENAYTIFFKPSEIPLKMTAKGPLVAPSNAPKTQQTGYYDDFASNTGSATCNSPGYGAPAYWNNQNKLGGCVGFDGWNFMCNSFAGFLNWKAIVYANKNETDSSGNPLYNSSVYVWKPNAGIGNHYQGSNNGGNSFDVNVFGEYKSANILSPTTDILSIAPFQAFMVHQETWKDPLAKTLKGTLTIDGCARGRASEDTTNTVYKTSGLGGIRFKVSVSTLTGLSDDVLLYFGELGSNDYDPSFDAPKLISGNYRKPKIGTFQDSTAFLGIDAREAIQDDPVTIDLAVIYADHGEPMTLEIIPIEPVPYSLAVKDKVTGKVHDFGKGFYNFYNDTLYYNSRFELLINHSPSALKNQDLFDPEVSMHVSNDILIIDPFEHIGEASIVVSNMAGQVVTETKTNLLRGQQTELIIDHKGVLIVSIQAAETGKVYTRKIVK